MPPSTTASTQTTGAGQLYPEDWNDDFSVIRFQIKQIISQMETMTPVKVTAVHAGSGSPPGLGTVDVQLLVSLVDGSGNVIQQGQVFGIPYMRVQSGSWAIIADPAANDFGFIIAASRDMSNVMKTPGVQPPGSYRKFSFSDGVFVPAPYGQAAPAATMWLKSDGTLQLTTQDGVVIKSDGSGNLQMTCTTLKVTGAITATGGITAGFGGADSVTLQHHVHAGNNIPPTAGT
jgi:hypothetical protein